MSLARHYALLSLEDTAAFSQILWTTLHGRPFYTDLPGLGRFAFTPHNYLGEHFSPLLVPILPLYALWPGPEVLLILQSLVLGLAAWPLYLLVRERFDDPPLATAFAAAWLLSPYVWQSNIADFHLDTFQALFLFSAGYCLLRQRLRPFLVFIALVLLSKEDAFVAVVGLGLFAMLAGEGARPAR